MPGLIIQGLMLGLVLAYYRFEPVRQTLNLLALQKQQWGYGFTVLISVFAGALLPEVLKICFFQKGSIRLENFREFAFGMIFWAILGCSVDTLYRFQGAWFGSTPSFAVLAKKVAVDQFIYNPIYAAPVTVWAYEWKNSHYTLTGISGWFTPRYYRVKVLPTLIATWGVWFPVVTIIYSLPPLLQIPLFGLALSFWVLLVTYINAKKKKSL